MPDWYLDEHAHAGAEHLDPVDVSPAMTAALRVRVASDGLSNVTVVDAGFLSYRHDGPPVDVVFSRNALHQMPDLWKAIALDLLHSLLRPGASYATYTCIRA